MNDLKPNGGNKDKHPEMVGTDWVQSIFSNLIQYYRCFENGEKVQYQEKNGMELILSESSGWPNFILGGNERQQENIELVVKNIREGNYPPFWIILNKENQEQLFREHGFLIVNRWAGMGMTLTRDSRSYYIPDGLSIKRVQEPDQLEHWFSIIEPTTLRRHKLNIAQFRLLADKKKLMFFVAYLGSTPVSSVTLLISEDVAGLYLLATNPSFRNKGYATAILEHTINIARQSACQRIVLHANPKAVNIYSKLGFRTFCDLNIFWLPPK